jgi:hypothetical protein
MVRKFFKWSKLEQKMENKQYKSCFYPNKQKKKKQKLKQVKQNAENLSCN